MVNNKKIGKTGYSYVIDKSEQIIIHPDPELLTFDAGQWDFIKEAKAMEKELLFMPYTSEGISKQAAFAQIDPLDWMVISILPDQEVTSLANQLILILILAVLITSICLVLFMYILMKKRILDRLSPLQELMYNASKGLLSERGVSIGKDEMASITESYNSLIDALGHFFKGLKQRMEEMEQGGSELAVNMEGNRRFDRADPG